jgi:pimeloyl-ACP methyl ester carboxylesterase
MSVLHMPLTKFTIPPLRPALLSRPSLISRLNHGCEMPLVLLSAGAGFGKTTLLSAWASQSPNPAADLFGYSLGGGVVLQTAIRHPEVVRKLALASTAFKRDGWYPEDLAALSAISTEAFV